MDETQIADAEIASDLVKFQQKIDADALLTGCYRFAIAIN